jgi:hypothetical protein
MRSQKILIAAAAIVAFAGLAHAGPVSQRGVDVHKEISHKFDSAEVVQVRSTKRPLERRKVANPGDEMVGYAGDNGDEQIGRVDEGDEAVSRSERRSGNGGGTRQALQVLTGILGGGNTGYSNNYNADPNYYPPQPRANAYANSLYAQCPVDYSGHPDRNCVAYINNRVAAANAPRYAQAYQCRTNSGIVVVSRTYHPGCAPMNQDGYGDY